MQKITFTRPDDWHVHLRDGDAMRAVVAHTARRFARAIIMPNLEPPITTTKLAKAYHRRILAALPKRLTFEPLMTLYLTAKTEPGEVVKAKQSGIIHGLKLYPAGATFHSSSGVTDPGGCFAVLEQMEKQDMPLLVHGEVTDPRVDIFDREKVFIERVLSQITQRFPRLRIVFEHITTSEAVEYVTRASDNVAATITAHHLLLNRNAMFFGGLRPHHYCLPLLKRETHRQSLIKAATSGNPKFFLGSDSAPHSKNAKQAACGCAGIYSAHAAIELYAEAFEQAGALDKLEAFASLHGADFYRLPRNSQKTVLVRRRWKVPDSLRFGKQSLVPLRAGEFVDWRLV
ncbi:MAG TPA: dihydroorotase [Burkholderiales bacterium]|nr:dihydroorotase [Burkholderiales bacterium]